MAFEYKARVLLSAYTQLNLGDDLLIKSTIERYPNTLFVIPCRKDYGAFFSSYRNVVPVKLNVGFTSLVDRIARRLEASSFYSLNSFLLWYLDLKYHITHYVVVGGSIFTEKPSGDGGDSVYKSYLRVKRILKGSKLIFVGCNFGPYISEQFKQNILSVLSIAEDVCFRDRKSYSSFPRKNSIQLGNDIVLECLRVPPVEKKKKIGISLISLKERNDLASLTVLYRKKMEEIITFFVNRHYEVVLFSFCKHLGDLDEAEILCSTLLHNPNVSIYSYDGNVDEALKIFGQMEYVVASRFHAVILGMLFNAKIFPIAYSNKTKEMLGDYGLWKDDYDIRNFINLDISNLLGSFISSYSVDTRDSQFYFLDGQLT